METLLAAYKTSSAVARYIGGCTWNFTFVDTTFGICSGWGWICIIGKVKCEANLVGKQHNNEQYK